MLLRWGKITCSTGLVHVGKIKLEFHLEWPIRLQPHTMLDLVAQSWTFLQKIKKRSTYRSNISDLPTHGTNNFCLKLRLSVNQCQQCSSKQCGWYSRGLPVTALRPHCQWIVMCQDEWPIYTSWERHQLFVISTTLFSPSTDIQNWQLHDVFLAMWTGLSTGTLYYMYSYTMPVDTNRCTCT